MTETTMKFEYLDVDKIVPNPFQPREHFEEEALRELADSLKATGDIQPIVVSRLAKGYQIIAGERRWRATKLAGLKKIPVLIRETTGINVLLESLIENLHRKDLTSTERENAVTTLWKTGKWETHVDLGKSLGKTENWVRSQIDAASIRKSELLKKVEKANSMTVFNELTPSVKKVKEFLKSGVKTENLELMSVAYKGENFEIKTIPWNIIAMELIKE